MLLKKIELVNFRNYEQLSLSFAPGFNFIAGDNAQGKSNLLESIVYLSTGKSYRGAHDAHLLRWQGDFFLIRGKIESNGRDFLLEVSYSPEKGKVLKINGVEKKKGREVWGLLKTVWFSPDDLNLVKGSPEGRREFLNQLLSQVSPLYAKSLQEYNKLLGQKNNLLKKREDGFAGGKTSLLEVYNLQLVQTGSLILKSRLDCLEKLIPVARRFYRELSGGETLSARYHSTVEFTSSSLEEIKRGFSKGLVEKKQEEEKKGYALVGPHRDELEIFVNGKSLRLFGSQGQQRTCVLALKLAAMEYFRLTGGEFPVLVLDEVMSELDESRREYLLRTIKGKSQVFVAGVDLSFLEAFPWEKEEVSFFIVEDGKVKEAR